MQTLQRSSTSYHTCSIVISFHIMGGWVVDFLKLCRAVFQRAHIKYFWPSKFTLAVSFLTHLLEKVHRVVFFWPWFYMFTLFRKNQSGCLVPATIVRPLEKSKHVISGFLVPWCHKPATTRDIIIIAINHISEYIIW